MPDKNILRQLQALPLSVKVIKSQIRIREWYEHFNGDVCVSFSGGKDSTVLAHLVHDLYPEVPLVFANTGLEYPEIQAFARKMGAEFVRPKMQFSEVISKYGYPIISKENAEAIYYARRIRNSVGGVLITDRKRLEINGSRVLRGGTREDRFSEKPRKVSGSKELEKVQFIRGGGYRETNRRRGDLTGVAEQIGQRGEETPLPG